MRKCHSQNTENAAEFCQRTLKEIIAPPSRGSMKERLLHAARKTGFGYYRVRDIWYADDRVSIKADELKQIEHLTGVTYGRDEIRDLDDLIAKAAILLEGDDPRLRIAMVSAFRAFLLSLAQPRVKE